MVTDEEAMREYNKKREYSPKQIKGNPKALSEAKMKRICNLIRCGNYVKTSVKACGVNYNTYMSCMRKGKQGIEPYDQFYEMQEEAKAEAETGMVGRLHESASNGNVGVDMWMLSRMYPQRWGKINRIEQKIDNSQKIEIVKFSDKKKEEK